MKYGCRNEKVGIKKLLPYWDVPARGVRSALALRHSPQYSMFIVTALNRSHGPTKGRNHRLGCSLFHESTMAIGLAVVGAACTELVSPRNWNPTPCAAFSFARDLCIGHPRTPLPRPILAHAEDRAPANPAGIAFSGLGEVRRIGINATRGFYDCVCPLGIDSVGKSSRGEYPARSLPRAPCWSSLNAVLCSCSPAGGPIEGSESHWI